MKKVKPQKSTLPISVSAKKPGLLKHQLFFTPYKIQWKNIQPAPVSQTSSRTFFNTMKNDLSNLKNDVERMIKKQIGRNDNKQSKIGVLEDTSNCKNDADLKYCSGSSKPLIEKDQTPQTSNFDAKPISPSNAQTYCLQEENLFKLEIEKNQKETKQKQAQVQNLLKETRIQKSLITELKKQNQQLYTQVQQKTKIQSDLENNLRLQKENKATQIEKLTAMVESLKQRIIELEDEVESEKIKNSDLQKKIQTSNNAHEQEVDDLRSHNSFLEQKIEGLSEKMSIVSGKFKQKQLQIKQLQTKLEASKISRREHQIQEEEQRKQIIEEWKNKIQQQQSQFENRLQEKLKTSQTEFMQQIQYIEARTKQAVCGLEEQNLQFSEKIKELEQQIKEFKASHKEGKDSPISSQNKLQKQTNQGQVDFSLLGAEFEKKINDLVSQNYVLKNKITELESQLESRQIEIGSLLEQIKLYEELKQYEKTNQSASSVELEKTIVELHDLRREKDSLTEQFEFKIMKLENELENERNSKPQKIEDGSGIAGANFNKILKDQLQENQELKQKLRQQTRQYHLIQNSLKQQEQKLSLLNEELAIEKMKVALFDKNSKQQGKEVENLSGQAVNLLKRDLEQLKKKYEALNSMLDTKNKQIKSKDEFIEKVLISKAGKKEQEQEIAYILKQIKSYGGQNC